MRYKFLLGIILFYAVSIRAHEGMWLPYLIEQQIFPAMQQAGCKITPEQIYSANKASLAHAIVRIGNGCSGGFLSSNGLVITNHHCVQYFISQLSNTNNNFLQQGFWAHSLQQEMQIHGLKVSVMLEIQDVTDSIVKPEDAHIAHAQLQDLRKERIKEVGDAIKLRYAKSDYSIEPIWGGNQYIMFVYRLYSDIRFVGFPPLHMASFGGDVDNWEWPRHSADFALLRIYADSAGLPSADKQVNIPLKPQKSLKIDARGVKTGDYTMVMGYPASTMNYASSTEIESTYRYLNPMQIQLRGLRLDPIKNYMNESPQAYSQYYSQYEKLNNYYKKWQGEQFGIAKSNPIERARQFEYELQKWILQDTIRSNSYGSLLSEYRTAYVKYFNTYYALMAYVESYWKMDFFVLGERFMQLYDDTEKAMKSIQKHCDIYYNTKNIRVEKQSFPMVMKALDTLIATHYLPKEYAALSISQRQEFIQTIINKSVLFNIDTKDEFLKKVYAPKHIFKLSKLHALLDSDPGILFVKQTMKHISNTLYKDYIHAAAELDSIQSLYYSCLFLYKGNELYADANSSMRVSFGNVLPYKTADAIHYAAQTTVAGIPQKWQSGIVDYSYNARLDSLIQHRQYGSYSTDSLFVNFAASNHTSGGNSGSPVLNAYGNFIGVNFDRNKEGTMSDIYFDERFCRNISVDIRYILFCIEMYGQASNIIQELEFVSPIK